MISFESPSRSENGFAVTQTSHTSSHARVAPAGVIKLRHATRAEFVVSHVSNTKGGHN